jgi:hypothetical protein
VTQANNNANFYNEVYTISRDDQNFGTIGSFQSRTFNVPDLVNGVEYNFAVTATNVAGESFPQSVDCLPCVIPNPPVLARPDRS